MKKFIISTLLICSLFAVVGCGSSENKAEIEAKTKELTVKMDAFQLQIGKILTDPKGIDQKALKDTLALAADTRAAISDLSDSGANWYDITQGALGGLLGRSALHGVRALIMAYLPGPVGTGIVTLLGMVLGGSSHGTEDKKKKKKS